MVFVHFVVCVFVWFMVDFVLECVFARNICLSKIEMFLQNGEGGIQDPLSPDGKTSLYLCVLQGMRAVSASCLSFSV